jgi:hypothetical protein
MVPVAIGVADQLEEVPPIVELAKPADDGKRAEPKDLREFDVVD